MNASVIENALVTPQRLEPAVRLISKRMERRFLDCGTALSELTQSCERLTEDSEQLIRMATARDEAERMIDETMSVLREPLEHLERTTAAMQNQVEGLAGCEEVVARLLHYESALQSVVAPLQPTQTLFRVEASRLPEDVRAAFASLTSQIELLHSQVRESLRTQFGGLDKANITLRAVTERLLTETAAQRKALEARREGITVALRTLSAEIERNSGRDVGLTSKSRAVAQAVSRIVVALQSHDIVTQRIDHALEGLANAAAAPARLREAVRGDDGGTEVLSARALLEIQAGHIEGVEEEIVKSSGVVASAVDEIGVVIVSLNRECVFLKEFTAVTAASNGTIQVLLEIVDEVRRLLAAVSRLAGDSLGMIRPVSDLSRQLTGSAETLSHQMNLVALNAQIQAVQIGAGTGLEVLAAHTARIAAETSRIGNSISEDLASLREKLGAEVDVFEGFCASGEVLGEYMESAGQQHERRLHEVRDGTLDKLHRVGEWVEQLRAAARRVAEQAQPAPGTLECLGRFGSSLRGASACLAHLLPAAGTRAAEIELDSHGSGMAGYTMATERETHRAVVAQLQSRHAAAAVQGRSEVEIF